MTRIPFNQPYFAGPELRYIEEALRSSHISGDGPFTKKCNALLEQLTGAPKALLTTSCTHALEVAAFLLEIRPGDEVIVPSFAFVSTANAFAGRGAKIVFADVRPDTLNIDESKLEALITPKTRAVVALHYAGVGCEMDAINEIAARHGITVVEDNAHGLLGRYKGRNLGTFGSMAAQSFHETKNFTCGEGGAILINDAQLVDRAEIVRQHGTNRSRFFRGQVDKYTWVDFGSSYIPPDTVAAHLFAQLEMRDSIQSTRQRIWTRYHDELRGWAEMNGVQQPTVPAHCEQPYHLYYLLLPSLEKRQAFIAHLQKRGVDSVFHYLPLHLSEMGKHFGGRRGDCRVSESVSDRLVRLPFYNAMTDAEQSKVIDEVIAYGARPAVPVGGQAPSPVVPAPAPPRPLAPARLASLRPYAIDALIALLFFIVATMIGNRHMQKTSTPPVFYQEYFGAPAASACGMGWVNPDPGQPDLAAFLSTKNDTVPCAALRLKGTSPATAFQQLHRYLMGSAALVWRIRGGVSWSSLSILFGILFGMTAAVAYAIGRLGLSRISAAIVAALVMLSGTNLSILNLLRDYGKAPWFLATIFLTTLLIIRERTRTKTIVIAALLGVILGIGFGFRTDLLTAIPAIFVAIVAFFPGSIRVNWRERLIALGAFVLAFAIVGAPIFKGMKMAEGGGTSEVTMEGLSTPFDEALGLERPYYDWDMEYSDTHLQLLVNMYSNWTRGNTTVIQRQTFGAEAIGREYLLRVIRHFPADMLTRGLAAVFRVLELPVNGMVNHLYLDPNAHDIGIADAQKLATLEARQASAVHWFGSITILMALATVVLIAVRDLRLAIWATFVILFFGAYTVLQFSLRHTFHLEIFGLWTTAFVIEAIVLTAWRWRKVPVGGQAPPPVALVPIIRAAILGAVLVIGIPLVLWTARKYQDAHVRSLVTQYINAPKQKLEFTKTPSTVAGRTVLHPIVPGAVAPTDTTFRADYLLLEMTDDHPIGPIIFWTRGVLGPQWDNSEQLGPQIPAALNADPKGVTRIFYPTYTGKDAYFDGIEVPDAMLPSIRAIYRLTPSSELPLPIWLQLRPDWESRPAHQRMWSADLHRVVRAFHDTPDYAATAGPDVDMTNEIASMGKFTKVEGGNLVVKGNIDAANGDFFHYKTFEATRGDTFFMEGEVRYGIIQLFAVAPGQFVNIGTAQPGPFRLAITVPADGKYQIIGGNTKKFGAHDIEITRAGWIKAR